MPPVFAPGTRFGAYEVIASLGEGGMGQVFRARDTRLNRDVALKVLPPSFANDPDRLARLTREAQILASLNHPNIAAVYGLENQQGRLALVMELVEGETLSRRIARGAMPTDEALPLARQIAEALEAAHEQGVIHRDLKPANIQIRADGTVKILDFGLAKAIDTGAQADSPEDTMAAMTTVGMILGTAAYMSPEQASGKFLDKRTDVWAFGVVFFEMLTGRRLFGDNTASHTLADVLLGPIDFAKIPAHTPRAIRDLLRRCLARDPRKRLRDIGEARIAIDEALSHGDRVDAVVTRPGTMPWTVAGAALVVIAALLIQLAPWRRSSVPDRPLIRLESSLGPSALGPDVSSIAISPDGTRLVYSIRGADGKLLLASRLLDSGVITPLPGTEGGATPFFSPDSKSIGFVADNKLKTVSLAGGIPVVVSDVTTFRGAGWGEHGEIIASLFTTGGLQSLPLAGGPSRALTSLAPDQFLHLRPQVLPGGHAVLFTASPSTVSLEDGSIQVVALDDVAGKPGAVTTVLSPGHSGRYVPTMGATGHLVYLRKGVFYAVAFDPVGLKTSGMPVPMLEDMADAPRLEVDPFSVSGDGTLVYRSGRPTDPAFPILWMDQSGQTEPLVKTAGFYSYPSFSPDGKRLAVVADTGRGQEIMVYDIAQDILTRVTFTGSQKRAPVWSPDGLHLAYSSAGPPSEHLAWIRADGSGESQVLLETKSRSSALVMSPDGKLLAFHDNKPDGDTDMWTLPLDTTDPEHPKPGTAMPLVQTPARESGPAFSPDGRYIAYFSNESGRYEIYVKPRPGPDGKSGPATWQVSTDGGIFPLWSPSGCQLFFRGNPGGRGIMVADCTTTATTFSSSNVRPWSNRETRSVGTFLSYAIAPDGKRFAVFPLPNAPVEDKGNGQVTFLLNFFDEVRRKVPVVK